MPKLRTVSKIPPVGKAKEQQECFQSFVTSTSKLKVLNLTDMEVADASLGFCWPPTCLQSDIYDTPPFFSMSWWPRLFIPSHWVFHNEMLPAYIWMLWGAATKRWEGATNRREMDWMIWEVPWKDTLPQIDTKAPTSNEKAWRVKVVCLLRLNHKVGKLIQKKISFIMLQPTLAGLNSSSARCWRVMWWRQEEPTQPRGWAPTVFSRGTDTFQAQAVVRSSGVLLMIWEEPCGCEDLLTSCSDLNSKIQPLTAKSINMEALTAQRNDIP